MREALSAHQALFLSEALPSTSAAVKGKAAQVVQQHVWDMGMDDFDDDEAATEDDSDEGDSAELPQPCQ